MVRYYQKLNVHFDVEDKFTIIFELIMIINYFHKNGFIYRDLRPNNIIIDENKNAFFFFDFDQMITIL